jgi:hypothetical protein
MHSKWLTLPVAALLAITLGAGVAAAANAIANGGFEDPTPIDPPPAGSVTSFANHWLSAPTGFPVVLSTDAHSGQYAALLSVPTGFGGSTMFQNSVAEGGLPPLLPGDAPVLTFWAKGDVGVTGNILVSLRYLDINGLIVYNSGNQFFQSAIHTATWTQITFAAPVVPPTAYAAFLELNTAVGPILDNRPNAVLVDDLELTVSGPVPVRDNTWGRIKSLWR